jgi:hypothetical protein
MQRDKINMIKRKSVNDFVGLEVSGRALYLEIDIEVIEDSEYGADIDGKNGTKRVYVDKISYDKEKALKSIDELLQKYCSESVQDYCC